MIKPLSLWAFMAALGVASCAVPDETLVDEPAASNDASIMGKQSKQIIWYDSVGERTSLFFNFDQNRHGITSKGSSVPEGHFGGVIEDCGSATVDCFHAGIPFSRPRLRTIASWKADDFDCRIVGNPDYGTVECYSTQQRKAISMELRGGCVGGLAIQTSGFEARTLKYRSREQGICLY